MGWGRTLLLGDIGNRLDIADTENDIQRLKRELRATSEVDRSQTEWIDWLIRENGEMKLYLVSLVRILMAKGHLTREELEAMVTAVDAEDGQADGEFKGKII